MQVKKQEILYDLLQSATDEFLANGYRDTSLRKIAANVHLTKGAIYSYFENKNHLFEKVVEPAINYLTYALPPERGEYNYSYSLERSIHSFNKFADIITRYKVQFKLLLFRASGSSFDNYRETIIQMYSESFHNIWYFFTGEEEHLSAINEMFIHTLASTYVSVIEEIVLHDPTKVEIDQYATQLALLIGSGIQNINLFISEPEKYNKGERYGKK